MVCVLPSDPVLERLSSYYQDNGTGYDFLFDATGQVFVSVPYGDSLPAYAYGVMLSTSGSGGTCAPPACGGSVTLSGPDSLARIDITFNNLTVREGSELGSLARTLTISGTVHGVPDVNSLFSLRAGLRRPIADLRRRLHMPVPRGSR
ncbi:MAG: hypothetical protein IPK12_01680 [Gemmatimonadetes bacterium]|nr:hypothetical protein [Gemmatimonadota bacterium]